MYVVSKVSPTPPKGTVTNISKSYFHPLSFTSKSLLWNTMVNDPFVSASHLWFSFVTLNISESTTLVRWYLCPE